MASSANSAGAADGRGWLALATAGGLGYVPVAPGSFGALGGVALHCVLAEVGFGVLNTLAVGLLLWLGALASEVAEAHFQRRDDGRIVIDEVVGQLIALLPVFSIGSAHPRDPVVLVAGFLLFRLFDIWKPGPVRAAERRFPGGWGVMLDDVVAGMLAALVLAVVVLP